MTSSVRIPSVAVLVLLVTVSFVEGESIVKARDPCLRPCPRIMRPVCASNGQTYSNKCVMQVAACRMGVEMALAYEGRCEDAEVEAEEQALLEEEAGLQGIANEEENLVDRPNCQIACPFIYLPVCASDGNTYPNECVFRAANCRVGDVLSVVYDGRCGEPRVEHLIHERDTEAVARESVRDECMRGCPRHYAPVCGSDGQTYANDCVFAIAACRAGDLLPLTIVHTGRCGANVNELNIEDDDEDEQEEDDEEEEEGERDECDRPCRRLFRQVCASNGETYNNHCLFLIANCRAGETLTVVSQGACPAGEESSEAAGQAPSIEDCMRGCTREYDPVCASDGTSHSNPCVFEIANCMAGGTLTVEYSGRCGEERPTRRPGNNDLEDSSEEEGNGGGRPKESSSRPRCSRRCPLNLDPVCASNGKTYGNQCRFQYAKCKRRGDLSIVQNSACEGDEPRRRRPSRGRRCRRPCPLLLAPVCASNGRTYANTCLFDNANCRARNALTVERQGRC